MKAKITIIDDNGDPKGVYESNPSRIYEGDISTKYVFEFEYNQLKIDEISQALYRTNLEMSPWVVCDSPSNDKYIREALQKHVKMRKCR